MSTSTTSKQGQSSSPPNTISTPATITSHSTQAQQSTSTLPTSQNVTEARAAVVASLGNMVDRKLQTRAATLHANAAALGKQERDVQAAAAALRREANLLEKEADGAARKLKEIGSVQNWAEVMEKEFLVLEETVRLANGGRSGSGSECSCSCSECGRSEVGDGDDDQMNLVERQNDQMDGKGKGKAVESEEDIVMEGQGEWSDASATLLDRSSIGTGQAKSSETGSTSTMA